MGRTYNFDIYRLFYVYRKGGWYDSIYEIKPLRFLGRVKAYCFFGVLLTEDNNLIFKVLLYNTIANF